MPKIYTKKYLKNILHSLLLLPLVAGFNFISHNLSFAPDFIIWK